MQLMVVFVSVLALSLATHNSVQVSDIVRDKWGHIFRFFNPGEDALFTVEYLQELGNEYAQVFHITDEKQLVDLFIGPNFVEYAMKNLYGDAKEAVNEEEFVASYVHVFETESQYFIGSFRKYYSAIFDVMDANGNGGISWSEFKRYYQRRLGGTTEVSADVRVAFDVIDANNDGTLSRDEYVGAYITYYTDPEVTHEQLPLF